MNKKMLLAAALSVAILSGCQTIKEEHTQYLNREQNIVNVVGSVWRIDAKWPGEHQANRLAEHLYTSAVKFCERERQAMLPIRGSTEDGTKDGSRPASGWLEFRCQKGLDYRPEYKGLTGTFDFEDLTDFSNTQK